MLTWGSLFDEVVVGAEGQVGVGRPGGDLLELGLLVARDRRVGVLDRPVVVGADRGRGVVALLLALGGDVDRVVVHHAAGHPLDAGDRRVVDLVGAEHRAGLEVVPQAQRVADLVHHHFLDRLAQELLGKLELRLLLLLLGLVVLLASSFSLLVLLRPCPSWPDRRRRLVGQGQARRTASRGTWRRRSCRRSSCPARGAAGAGPGSGPSRRGRRRGPSGVAVAAGQVAHRADRRPGARRSRRSARRVPGGGQQLAVSLLRGHDRADHLADRQGDRADGLVAGLALAGRDRHPHEEGVFFLPGLDPARVEDHVAVDDLAGQAGCCGGPTSRRCGRW